MPHASIASPILSFMVPPAAVSAVAYAPHCRAGDEESPDVFGRRREEIQARKWRVAGALSSIIRLNEVDIVEHLLASHVVFPICGRIVSHGNAP